MSDSVKVGAAVPLRFILSNISAFIFNSSSRRIVTYCEQDNVSISKKIDRPLVFLIIGRDLIKPRYHKGTVKR